MKTRFPHTALLALSFLILSTNSALAHVTVKPSEVKVAAYQSFTVAVPVEKEIPTIAVRLVIPEGLLSVMPNVKPGWKIALKKEGDLVTEIEWTGGVIPVGQRDEFVFSAKTPSDEATLSWKAYQTYQGGEIVAWDTDPKSIQAASHDGGSTQRPYSTTTVVKDSVSTEVKAPQSNKTADTTSLLTLAALVLSTVSIGMHLFKRK